MPAIRGGTSGSQREQKRAMLHRRLLSRKAVGWERQGPTSRGFSHQCGETGVKLRDQGQRVVWGHRMVRLMPALWGRDAQT